MENKRRKISLISVEHDQDEIGQIVETETAVEVIATLQSVSQNAPSFTKAAPPPSSRVRTKPARL